MFLLTVAVFTIGIIVVQLVTVFCGIAMFFFFIVMTAFKICISVFTIAHVSHLLCTIYYDVFLCKYTKAFRKGKFFLKGVFVMTTHLPEKFCQRMKLLLNDDYDTFIRQYDKDPFKGLRVNTLKCSVEKLRSLLDTELMPSPFSPLGFYVPPDEKLGNNPLHHAGAFLRSPEEA